MSALLKQMMQDTPSVCAPLAGSTLDVSGRGRHGTASGGITYDSTFFGNQCAVFSNGLITFGSWSPVGTYPIIIEFWILPSSSTPIGLFDTAPGTTNVLRNYPGGTIEWWNAAPTLALPALSTTNWTHVGLRFNYNGSSVRSIESYINGAYGSAAVVGASPGASWTTLVLGGINSGSAGYYAGKMAYFAAYSGSESSADIVSTLGGSSSIIVNAFTRRYQAGVRGRVSY